MVYILVCVFFVGGGGTRHPTAHQTTSHNATPTPTTIPIQSAGPWSQLNVERGANLLIPVPDPLGGVVIVGSQTLTYHRWVLVYIYFVRCGGL